MACQSLLYPSGRIPSKLKVHCPKSRGESDDRCSKHRQVALCILYTSYRPRAMGRREPRCGRRYSRPQRFSSRFLVLKWGQRHGPTLRQRDVAYTAAMLAITFSSVRVSPYLCLSVRPYDSSLLRRKKNRVSRTMCCECQRPLKSSKFSPYVV